MLETGEIIPKSEATIEELAPNVLKVKTAAEVRADFTPPSIPPPADPVLTNECILAIYAKLRDVPGNGGFVKIAQACGVPVYQVETIDREIKAILQTEP